VSKVWAFAPGPKTRLMLAVFPTKSSQLTTLELLLLCSFALWNKSPIGLYLWLLVFEYSFDLLSLDHDGDDEDDDGDNDGDNDDDPVNSDNGRRQLLLTRFFAANLPN